MIHQKAVNCNLKSLCSSLITSKVMVSVNFSCCQHFISIGKNVNSDDYGKTIRY